VVYLLEKNGTLSKYILDEEIYEMKNIHDSKEFLNRIHFNNK